MKVLKVVVGIILTIALIIASLSIFDGSQYALRTRVKSLLGLKNVPISIQHVACVDWGFSDVLAACYFEIKPDDFNNVLAGYFKDQTAVVLNKYALEHIKLTTYSKDVAAGPTIGPEFPVAESYHVTPKPFEKNGYSYFKNGGRISLYTNIDKSKMFFTYYEE